MRGIVYARACARSFPGLLRTRARLFRPRPATHRARTAHTPVEPAADPAVVPLHGSPGVAVPPSSPTQDGGPRSPIRCAARAPGRRGSVDSNKTRFNVVLIASVLLVWAVVSVAFVLRTSHVIRRAAWEHARNATTSTPRPCSATDATCITTNETVTADADWKSISLNSSLSRSGRRRRKMTSGPRRSRKPAAWYAEEVADGALLSVGKDGT
ncbi:hypothetical protein MTO96_038266 [Rhipicephalus appendiculatus]